LLTNKNEQINSIPPSHIRLDDPYLRRAFSLETKYLLSIEEDRLLCGFRETAGLDMRGKQRYGGWENSLIGGHTMGHYLSAAARASICAEAFTGTNTGTGVAAAFKKANTGTGVEASAEVQQALREKVYRIVDELLICQEHSRGKKGFLFGAVLADPEDVEIQFDNVERGLTNIMTEAWVPWYTMHKILAGLLDAYRYTAYEPSLAVAKNLGDWVADRCLKWDADTVRQVLAIEYGGMNDCMYELYAFTGEARYAKAAHVFDEEELFERVLGGGKNVLNDRHANTTIPKFVGALNRYLVLHGEKIDGQTVDAGRYLEYAKAFWEMVISHHTYLTGGNSEWEHFGMDDILNAERTNCNNETCNVYNLLKLSEGLYRITGEKKYMDFYERAFVNTILSSQNPTTGMTTYFQPMANGYFKVYATPFDKFWCCTGSGMENFTRLNEGIYHIREREIFVNRYFSSGFEECGISLTQDCNLEVSDVVKLSIQAEASEAKPWVLKLRIPDWVKGEISLKKITETGETVPFSPQELTGTGANVPIAYEISDGYAAVTLTEEITQLALTLPKKVCAASLPDAPDVVGFSYGPYVLSADLGTEDMRTTVTGVDVTIPAERLENCDTLFLPEGVSPKLVLADADRYFQKDEAEPVFRFAGSELLFSPHYRKYKSRYGIYWKLTTASDTQTSDERAFDGNAMSATKEKIIDTIQPGYGQYENDELHQMTERDSRGITNEGTSRYALPGGYFGYRIAVEPDQENILEFTVKKADAGKYLRVTVEGNALFDGQLGENGEAEPIGQTDTAGQAEPTGQTDTAGQADSAGQPDTDGNDEYQMRLPIPEDCLAQSKQIMVNGELRHTVELRFSGRKDEPSARVCKFIYTKINRGDRPQ
jgi:hypothetical protein